MNWCIARKFCRNSYIHIFGIFNLIHKFHNFPMQRSFEIFHLMWIFWSKCHQRISSMALKLNCLGMDEKLHPIVYVVLFNSFWPSDTIWRQRSESTLAQVMACCLMARGWVGLWGFLWWAPSAKRKDHHGVSSGWSSVWHRSNTGLSSTQYEQIPIILGVWPFWLTPFFFGQ